MTILSPGGTAKGLCAGDTHVFQIGSPTCDCGQWGAATQPANPYPLSGGFFPGYTPTAVTAPDVPIRVFRAAKDAGASHLSADGKRIYCERLGVVLKAEWDGNGWGSWWAVAEIPGDAVAM